MFQCVFTLCYYHYKGLKGPPIYFKLYLNALLYFNIMLHVCFFFHFKQNTIYWHLLSLYTNTQTVGCITLIRDLPMKGKLINTVLKANRLTDKRKFTLGILMLVITLIVRSRSCDEFWPYLCPRQRWIQEQVGLSSQICHRCL